MAKHPLRLRSRHVAQLRCVGALSVIAVIAGCNSGTPSPAASNALNVGSGAASPPCRHVRNTALDAALPVACQDQDLPLVRSLLARGADANARDKDGHTSLILAVNADNIDLVRLLLSSGAQAELTDRAGHRPIQYCENRAMQDALKPSWDEATENLTFAEAVEFSDTARVRDLLGSGTSADTYIGNLPALLTATEDGHVEVAKLLIKAGANTEWTDDRTEIERWFSLESPRWEVPRNTVGSDRPWHGTALTYAAMYGYPEIVRALIEARAKLDARDALGETPIFRAVNPECVKLLLKAGANVHARDLQGLTPLFSVGDGRCRSEE